MHTTLKRTATACVGAGAALRSRIHEWVFPDEPVRACTAAVVAAAAAAADDDVVVFCPETGCEGGWRRGCMLC